MDMNINMKDSKNNLPLITEGIRPEQMFIDYFKNNNQEMSFDPTLRVALEDIFMDSKRKKHE
jgi:hypothetical protein